MTGLLSVLLSPKDVATYLLRLDHYIAQLNTQIKVNALSYNRVLAETMLNSKSKAEAEVKVQTTPEWEPRIPFLVLRGPKVIYFIPLGFRGKNDQAGFLFISTTNF